MCTQVWYSAADLGYRYGIRICSGAGLGRRRSTDRLSLPRAHTCTDVHLACLKPYTRSFYLAAAMHLICDAVAYGFQEALVQPFGYEGFDDPDLEYPFQPAVMLCIFFRKFCGAFEARVSTPQSYSTVPQSSVI